MFPDFTPIVRNVFFFLRNYTVNTMLLYVHLNICTLYILYMYTMQQNGF